jgi:hypothetical protein
MINTTKGFTKSLIIFLIFLVVVVIILIARYKYIEAPSTTPIATSTEPIVINETATTSGVVTLPQEPNDPLAGWKRYENNTIGISFRYPKDFFLKSDQFAQTGEWTATFISERGAFDIKVAKSIKNASDIKTQTITTKVGNKDAPFYIARRDVCDVAVTQTSLDIDYQIQLTFQSCGTGSQTIIKDRGDITSVLESFSLSTVNTKLYIDTQLGIAFRYPLTLKAPVKKTAATITGINFGDALSLSSGIYASAELKKNLTAQEVAIQESTNAELQTTTLDGRPAFKVVRIPTSGPKERSLYASHKSDTNVLKIHQIGIDSNDFDTVVSTFTFIK